MSQDDRPRKSLDELRKRFRYHLAGMALYGMCTEAKGGPLDRAHHALEVPAEVDRLLEAIHKFYSEVPTPSPNGPMTTPPTPARRT